MKVIDSFVYPIETLRYNVQLRFHVFESNANGKIRFNRTKKSVKSHAHTPEKNRGKTVKTLRFGCRLNNVDFKSVRYGVVFERYARCGRVEVRIDERCVYVIANYCVVVV